jgi:hypothetical protein
MGRLLFSAWAMGCAAVTIQVCMRFFFSSLFLISFIGQACTILIVTHSTQVFPYLFSSYDFAYKGIESSRKQFA